LGPPRRWYKLKIGNEGVAVALNVVDAVVAVPLLVGNRIRGTPGLEGSKVTKLAVLGSFSIGVPTPLKTARAAPLLSLVSPLSTTSPGSPAVGHEGLEC
jgi:hypothetical protein